MRILIVKLSSIGDVVHALPVLAWIKQRRPEARVSWVVERGAAEILRNNPLLERLIEIDTRAVRRGASFTKAVSMMPEIVNQFSVLRALKFDVAIDLQGLLKSAAIARLSGAERRYGFERAALREPASRFLLNRTVPIAPGTHVIRKNLSLAARALGVELPTDGESFQFPIHVQAEHEHEASVVRARAAVNHKYAILNPGGGWPTKQWSAESFGALADLLWTSYGLPSIVTYGPGETALAERVVAASRTNAARAASLSLRGFYALARRATVYVGGDTGPTHLAVAAGAPIVGLFGPTEWWRNGSPRESDIVVERTEITCRTACHRRACSQWVCMDINVDAVFRAVGERLRRTRIDTPEKRSSSSTVYA